MKLAFSTEFKVGLTVIVSTAILIFSIIWGKNLSFEKKKIQIQVEFENVGGMVPGDPVTVNGVKVGKVLHVNVDNKKVRTTLTIDEDVPLYEDADFVVISAELLAGMRVEIFPGHSDVRINMAKQPFQGRYGGRIVDVGLTIDALARNVSALTFRLDTTVTVVNHFLREGRLQKNINGTLNNLNKVTASLNQLLVSNSTSLNHAVQNLEQGSGKFNALMDSNKVSISSTLQNFKTISTRLDTVSSSLQVVMKKIENKDGTLGKMVYDSTLYDNLNKTLITIDSLAQQIKKDGLDIDLF